LELFLKLAIILFVRNVTKKYLSVMKLKRICVSDARSILAVKKKSFSTPIGGIKFSV
jgi:hypothetical protein